ncbi:MAG: hypothetical protein LBK61_08870 [Spirochaetaceae bacterium]|nr:hypothetical protein [Spirochaetaceae bacterium]
MKPIPDSSRESAAGRQSTPLRRTALPGAKTQPGFHPFVKPISDSGRGISGRQAEYRHAAAGLPLRARNAAA